MIPNELPQKASFGPETCEIEPKVAMWGIRRTGFPPEDSPLFYRASTRHHRMNRIFFVNVGKMLG